MRKPVALACLLAALVLAGCSGGSASFAHTHPPTTPTLWGNPTLREEVVGELTFSFLPGSPPIATSVRVPNGTVQLLAHVTLDRGASSWLRANLQTCAWEAPSPAVAEGQTWTFACGVAAEGEAPFELDAGEGALSGRVRVVAQVCGEPHQRAGCFRAPPPA